MIRCVWGHDVGCPRVELPRPMPPRALGFVRKGCRHWREYFGQRHAQRPELLRTYHGRWTRAQRPPLDWHQWKRSESAELHARLGQLLLVHADVRSGDVGQLDAGGELRRFRYGELAELLACSIGQLKRALRTFRAAGYIWRHQGRDFDPAKPQPYVARVASLRVLRGFWSASGVLADRDHWVEKAKRAERADRDDQAARDRYREQAARDRIRAQLQQLADAAGARALSWRETERAVDDELARRRPPPGPPNRRPPG